MIENVLTRLNESRGVFEFVLALAAVWAIAWEVFRKANAEFEEKIIQTVQEATAQIQVDAKRRSVPRGRRQGPQDLAR